jgi:hypothetical protein
MIHVREDAHVPCERWQGQKMTGQRAARDLPAAALWWHALTDMAWIRLYGRDLIHRQLGRHPNRNLAIGRSDRSFSGLIRAMYVTAARNGTQPLRFLLGACVCQKVAF